MNNETRKYNYGIAILRIWMCFEVVCMHLLPGTIGEDIDPSAIPFYKTVIYQYKSIAVPIFFLMAFIFTDITLLSGDKPNVKKRFSRLVIPHVVWSVLLFALYIMVDLTRTTKHNYGIKELVLQLLFAGGYNKQQWFQIDLIIITAFLLVVFALFGKYSPKLTWFILLVSIIFQYDGINLKIYNLNMPEYINPGHLVFVLGRICECMPFAAIGALLCYYNILDKIKEHRYMIILMSCGIICLLIKYGVFIQINGYGYQGIYRVVLALITFILFYYLPIDKFIPEFIGCVIRKFSSVTMFVYFAHIFVDDTVGYLIGDYAIFQNKFLYSGLIFVISVVAGLIISLIPSKLVKECCG